jgi:hypothetical protein
MNNIATESPSYWALCQEGRELLQVYNNIKIAKVDRVSNVVAHVLAHLGISSFSGVLCDATLAYARELIVDDCKHIV